MNGRYTSTSTSYYYEWKITGLEYWTPECKNEENTSTYMLFISKKSLIESELQIRLRLIK